MSLVRRLEILEDLCQQAWDDRPSDGELLRQAREWALERRRRGLVGSEPPALDAAMRDQLRHVQERAERLRQAIRPDKRPV